MVSGFVPERVQALLLRAPELSVRECERSAMDRPLQRAWSPRG